MSPDISIGIAAILGLGMLAQMVAWRLHLPAILLLMLSGIVAGPYLGFIQPDLIFGNMLIPLVSISVGIILFEGGLDLSRAELKQVGNIVRNLVTVGMIVTWVLASGAAMIIFGLDLRYSLILGAILVVTGPTVIIPLLRHIRLTGKSSVGTVLKWEGIVIDPIGAVFAVLVLHAAEAGGFEQVALLTFEAVIYTIIVGGLIGLTSSWLLIVLFKHHLVPDVLKNPLALALVVVSFVVSNHLQHEAGLLATTLMGVVLANQKWVRIKQLAEFKETLRVLLISALFVVLSARIDLNSFSELGWQSAIFTAALIFVVRPASVFISTIRSDLNFKEKLFLSALAPRGIVAAAVASIFVVELDKKGITSGVHQADIIADITFMVIIGTVTVYGLFSPIVARMLGLSTPHPQGILFVGAHTWARKMAKELDTAGVKVSLFDTNALNVKRAQDLGLNALNINVVFDPEIDELVLDGIGKLVALTPNDEVNTLSGFHFTEHFGESCVYQLCPQFNTGEGGTTQNLPTRILFGKDRSFSDINSLYESGSTVQTLEIQEEIEVAKLEEQYDSLVPFFHVKANGDVEVISAVNQPRYLTAGRFICLAKDKP